MNRTMEAPSAAYLAGLRISNLARAVLGRWVSAAPAKRNLFVEERIAIGPKKDLILVHCAGRRYLVAAAGDVMTSLGEVRPCGEAVPDARSEECL